MFNSLLGPASRTGDAEHSPTTGFPWVWIGFLFAIIFFFAEFLIFLPGIEEQQIKALLLLIILPAVAYWLFCIYKLHKIINEIAPYGYGISPAEAVGKHFIPILNLIWLFQWPSAMSDYINERGRVRVISGKLIGLLFLLSTLLRFFDGAVGFAATFAVTMYLATKLRRHVELGDSPAPIYCRPHLIKKYLGMREEARLTIAMPPFNSPVRD